MQHRVSIPQAIRAHWLSVVATCMVLACLGSLYALSKPATFTAQSRMLVGSFDTRVTSIPGMALASEELAATYSRLASTSPVIELASKNANAPVSQVSGKLSASPVVGSPIIVLTATGSSQEQAVQFANAGTQALAQYVRSLNPNTADSLIQRYESTNRDLLRAQGQLNQLETQSRANPNNTSLAEEADAKRSEVNALQLQSDALSKSYGNVADAGGFGLQTIQSAAGGGSDRRANFQMYTFLGFFVGLVISTAFAVWREDRRHQRRQRYIKTPSAEAKNLTTSAAN